MRRLLLTSTGFTNRKFERLFIREAELSPAQIKVLFIPTAAVDEAARAVLPYCMADLNNAGIPIENIKTYDLDYLLSEREIKQYNAVYVCGGSTKHLLTKMNAVDFKQTLECGFKYGMIYIGVSAGAIACAMNHPDNLGYFDHCLKVHCENGDPPGKIAAQTTICLSNQQAIWIKEKDSEIIE